MGTTYTRRQSQPVYDDVEDSDDLYVTRTPSSARRYKPQDTIDYPMAEKGTLVQRRRSSLNPHTTNGVASTAITPGMTEPLTEPPKHRRSKRIAIVTILIGMVVTISLLMSLSMLQNWWQTYQDDIHYGNPRTSQLDAVVGHGDSASNKTHFIFLNLHGHIQIIEIPGGDPTRIRSFNGPNLYGNGADLVPVTGQIRNDNGRYDLVLMVQGQPIVFINDGTTFHQQ